MIRKHWLLSTLTVLVVCSGFTSAQPGTKVPKKYVVDLDLPPEQRWEKVILDNIQIIQDVHKVISTYIPEEFIPYVELIAADLDSYIKQPYAGEMIGIAKAMNVSVGDIVMVNLIYDVSAFCTSIVSQDDYGQIWHSRNLDYSFTDILKNITIAVDFLKGGKTSYSVITYAGYIGVLSGQRPNAFTITVDERDQGYLLWNLIIGLLDKNTDPVSFLVRDALSMDDKFEDAITRLSYTTTAADVYFIIAGVNPGEGAVITKGRFAPDDTWRLNPADGRWFLVETNYDHWLPPPESDNRRDPAIKAMKTMGQKNITVETLFNVMSTPKVLNSGTTYTVIMSAAKPSLMQTWIRV